MDVDRWPALAAALTLVTLAAVIDLRSGRIPNWLTVSGLALGLILGVALGGPPGLLSAACGALVAALVPLLLFRAGALGGGDVKLFAALGTLLGGATALEAETLAFAGGALWGVVRWLRAGRLVHGLKAVAGLLLPVVGRRLLRDPAVAEARAVTIRFGPAVALGTYGAVALLVAG